MEGRPVSLFWRILPYPFYALAVVIGVAALFVMVDVAGALLGLLPWLLPLPNDR
jgi:hypothetical protein